jgi:hypothetical protein
MQMAIYKLDYGILSMLERIRKVNLYVGLVLTTYCYLFYVDVFCVVMFS